MPELSKYRQGRLIWATLRSRNGKRELRPAVIISADRDITQPEKFDPRKNLGKVNAVAVVGISTEFRKYPPYIQVPYSGKPGGHSVTTLTQDCVVCIGRYDWVTLEDDVLGGGGDVPRGQMDEIMGAIAKDLEKKLAGKAGRLSSELSGISELLASLIGEP